MNPALLGSVAALAWGTHDFVARFASRRVGSVNTVLAVTVSGIAVLSLWLWASGTPVRVVWPSLWLVAVTGISFALATMWLFAALAIGPISIVSPIVGSFPAYAVAFAVATGARPSLLEWLAMAAVVIGVVVVSRSGAGHEEIGDIAPGRFKWVLVLSFLSSFGFALSLTSGQVAAPVFGEVQTAWLARFFGLGTVGLFYLSPKVTWHMPRPWWPVMFAMGALDVLALSSVVAAGNLPASEVATVTASAFGAVTVLLARLILKERMTPLQVLGIVQIFLGVAVLSARL